MIYEQEIQADREAAIHDFVKQYSDEIIKKMEFRFFRSGSKWTALFYKNGEDLERYMHSGESTYTDLAMAVLKIYEIAESHAYLLAIHELHKRGVR